MVIVVGAFKAKGVLMVSELRVCEVMGVADDDEVTVCEETP